MKSLPFASFPSLFVLLLGARGVLLLVLQYFPFYCYVNVYFAYHLRMCVCVCFFQFLSAFFHFVHSYFAHRSNVYGRRFAEDTELIAKTTLWYVIKPDAVHKFSLVLHEVSSQRPHSLFELCFFPFAIYFLEIKTHNSNKKEQVLQQHPSYQIPRICIY